MGSVDGVNTNNIIPKQRGSAELTQDSFLKLLMTQLKMQNPMNPFDGSTMMQQIAQLTSLSASQEMQKSIKLLSESINTSQIFSASHLVGKEVQILSDRAQLVEGKPLSGSVLVPPGVNDITMEIRDENDKLIKTMQLHSPSAGVLDFAWDGMDEDGKKMANGVYKISAKSMLKDQETALPTAANYKVNSIAMDRNGKGVVLNVDALGGIYLDDVIKIL